MLNVDVAEVEKKKTEVNNFLSKIVINLLNYLKVKKNQKARNSYDIVAGLHLAIFITLPSNEMANLVAIPLQL